MKITNENRPHWCFVYPSALAGLGPPYPKILDPPLEVFMDIAVRPRRMERDDSCSILFCDLHHYLKLVIQHNVSQQKDRRPVVPAVK